MVSPYISDYPDMNENVSILEMFDSNKPNINAHCENIFQGGQQVRPGRGGGETEEGPE